VAKHPGRILADDFLGPLDLNASSLAGGLSVNRSTVSRLLAGQQPLTPAMAARLGAFFRVPARWWLLMQAEYDAARVEAAPEMLAGVTPMEPDAEVLLTPKGVLRLGESAPCREPPLTISQEDIASLPPATSSPTPRDVREIRREDGSVALVGEPL